MSSEPSHLVQPTGITASVPPNDTMVLVPYTSHLTLKTHPRLAHLGLVVNSDLNMLICLSCSSAQRTGGIREHLKRIHKASKVKVTDKDLQLFASVGLRDDWAEISYTQSGVAPYEGLTQVQTMGCPSCSTSGCAKVVKKCAATHSMPGTDFPHVLVQSLNPNKPSFRVVANVVAPRLMDVDRVGTFLKQVTNIDWIREATLLPQSPRMLNAWLKGSGWADELVGLNIDGLLGLAASPDKQSGEFKGLQAVVLAYATLCTKEILRLDSNTLKKLNSPDPTKEGWSHTPFRRHEQASSLRMYCVETTQMVAALLRGLGSTPIYSFSIRPETVEALQKFKKQLDLDKQATPKLLDLLHTILLSLWHQEYVPSTTISFPNPTIRFLAVASIGKDKTFKHPKYVTNPIAHLCHLIVLTTIHAMVADMDRTKCSAKDAFQKVAKFVREPEDTAFSALRSLQHLASTFAYLTLSMPVIFWIDRVTWQEMLFKGHRIYLSAITKAFRERELELVVLFKELCLGLPLRIDYDSLSDDLNSKSSGYCFLDDPRNPFIGKRDILIESLVGDPALRSSWTRSNGDGELVIDVHVARPYFLKSSKFERKAMAYNHVTDGASARGTEACAMIIRNSPFFSRNIYAVFRWIAHVTQYTKTSGTARSDQLIPHACSAFMADLIIQYHAIVRPFLCLLLKNLWPTETEVFEDYRTLLWIGHRKPFESEELSEELATMLSGVTTAKIGLAPWRHIVIGVGKKLCKNSDFASDELEEDDRIRAIQSGHSYETEKRIYGLTHQALGGADDTYLQSMLEVSTDFQRAWKIVPSGGSRALPFTEALVDNYEALIEEGVFNSPVRGHREGLPKVAQTMLSNLLDRYEENSERRHLETVSTSGTILKELKALSGRLDNMDSLLRERTDRPRTPPQVSFPISSWDGVCGSEARQVTQSPSAWEATSICSDTLHGASSDVRRSTGSVCIELHNDLLDSPSAPPNLVHSPQIRSPTVLHSSPSPRIYLEKDDVLDALGRLINTSTPRWSCKEQREAVELLLDLENDIGVFLTTGLGKSLVAILPSLFENGITIVVAPLTSLLAGWVERMTKMGVAHEVWSGQPESITGTHNLVLVSADKAKSSLFRERMTVIHHSVKPVLRQVIDEAQFYFMYGDFREAMRDAFELRFLPFQIVLLSGTVPPPAEPFLIDIFGLKTDQTTFIRTTAHRREITFTLNSPIKSISTALEDLVDEFEYTIELDCTEPEDKILIFVAYEADGSQLAAALSPQHIPGTEFYHSGAGSESEKEAILARWQAVDGPRAIVSTSALEAGGDFPHVRAVYHIGHIYSMASYMQQVGRGGRDGRNCDATVYPYMHPPTSKTLAPSLGGALAGQKEVRQMFWPEKKNQTLPQACLNYQMLQWSDALGKTCAELEDYQGDRNMFCSVCDDSDDPSSLPRKWEGLSDSVGTQYSLAAPRHLDLKRKVETAFGEQFEESNKRRCEKIDRLDAEFAKYAVVYQYMHGVCVMCEELGEEGRSSHPYGIDKCFHAKRVGGYRNDFQWNVKFPPRTNACWTCYLSSKGGNRLHGEILLPRRDESACQLPGFLVGLCIVLTKSPSLAKAAEATVGFRDWNDAERTAVFISKAHVTHGTNAMALLHWYGEFKGFKG